MQETREPSQPFGLAIVPVSSAKGGVVGCLPTALGSCLHFARFCLVVFSS